MSNNFTNTSLLIRLLDMELSTEELTEINNRLLTDSALTGELENLKNAQLAVQGFGLRQQVATIHQLMMPEFRNNIRPLRSINQIVRLAMRVAAVLVFVFAAAAIYFYFSVSLEKLVAENYSVYTIGTERDASKLSLIEEAFQRKDFDSVIQQLKNSASPDMKVYFFGGLAYLEKNDAANAIIQFKTMMDRNNNASPAEYPDEAEYYLALSYLKNNDIANALPLYEKIHSDKLHRYHDKVSGWFLRKLKILHWKED